MELESDIETDIKMDDGNLRYLRLHEIVEDLKTNSICRTADWYLEHNDLLLTYEKYFKSGFSDIHPEITDTTFRRNCLILDTLLTKLLKDFDIYQWFSLYDYLSFNEIAINIVDTVFAREESEDDRINNLFANMKV
jgi:hypothetical protein